MYSYNFCQFSKTDDLIISDQNIQSFVLITDNEIVSFAKLAEVVVSSHLAVFYWGYFQ